MCRSHGVLTKNIYQIIVAWILDMQKVCLSASIKDESDKVNSNKAYTFLKRSSKQQLVVLIQAPTS